MFAISAFHFHFRLGCAKETYEDFAFSDEDVPGPKIVAPFLAVVDDKVYLAHPLQGLQLRVPNGWEVARRVVESGVRYYMHKEGLTPRCIETMFQKSTKAMPLELLDQIRYPSK